MRETEGFRLTNRLLSFFLFATVPRYLEDAPGPVVAGHGRGKGETVEDGHSKWDDAGDDDRQQQQQWRGSPAKRTSKSPQNGSFLPLFSMPLKATIGLTFWRWQRLVLRGFTRRTRGFYERGKNYNFALGCKSIFPLISAQLFLQFSADPWSRISNRFSNRVNLWLACQFPS